jgi:hypothetical protein
MINRATVMQVAVRIVYRSSIESGFISLLGCSRLMRVKYANGLNGVVGRLVNELLVDRVSLEVDAAAPSFWKKLQI